MSLTSENVTDLKEVTIYTDGGAVPNPGRGGYGVVLRFGKHAKELSGGYALTTNNRMELMAVIVGLEALKGTMQGSASLRLQIHRRCHHNRLRFQVA